MIGLLSDIVQFKNLIEVDEDFVIVEFAVFKKDFFPWHKGDEVHVLQLAHKEKEEETWLEEMDEDKVVQACRVKLISEAAQASG